LPALARCYPRRFTFYVAYPIHSIPPSVSSRRDLKNSESRVAVCRAARFRIVFKIGAERFSGDPSFTRSHRSMSLTEVRRLD
jgi:hypothetical protein